MTIKKTSSVTTIRTWAIPTSRDGPNILQNGKFIAWRVRLVQDLLLTEEIEDDDLFNEVILCSTENEGQDDVESETRKFLKKIAILKKMKPLNVNSWVDAMWNKLEDIGITKISHLRQEIVQVNKKLRDYGHSMLHTRTLHLLAQEAEREVVSSAQQMNDEIT
jgi:hypothetical protein